MTILNTFIKNLNIKYGKIHPIDYAKTLFKENADVGTAIVSVLSSTGIAGFKFHIPQSEQVKMESDITDHYTDTNTVIQDHIARRPIQITLTGLQGEYFYSVNKIEDTLALVVPTMKLCKEFLPKLNTATVQTKLALQKNYTDLQGLAASYAIYDKTVPLSQKFSTTWNNLNGVDLFKLFQDIYKLKSAQTRAFLYLQAMWLSEKPFTVETTWRRYDNMLIQSLVPIRDNNADVTDFTVTFKQVNFAQSQYTDLKNAAKLTRQQLMKKVNKGVNKGEEVKVI